MPENLLTILSIILFFLNDIDSSFNDALFSRLQNNNDSTLSLDNECDKRITRDEEFKKCRVSANETWFTNDHKNEPKNLCCYNWDIVDCIVKSIVEVCILNISSVDYRIIFGIRDEWINYHEKIHCKDYKYGSIKCQDPEWALIVFSGILFFGIFVFTAFFVRRKYIQTTYTYK
jgi:hypothetical protein